MIGLEHQYRTQLRRIERRAVFLILVAPAGLAVLLLSEAHGERPLSAGWLGLLTLTAMTLGIWSLQRSYSALVLQAAARGSNLLANPAADESPAEPGGPPLATRRQLVARAHGLSPMGMPHLHEAARERLLLMYGPAWLSMHESLLSAMLVYVARFRVLAAESDGGSAREDPAASCLLSIVGCMREAGVFDQPTILLGHSPAAFATAMDEAGPNESDAQPRAPRSRADMAQASTSFILLYAISYAVDAGAPREAA